MKRTGPTSRADHTQDAIVEALWQLEARKTPGQLAYERDVREHPFYHDGKLRPTWRELGDLAHWSWERMPSVRNTV